MARFISVEIDASQLRVAEIEEVGKKERILQCFSIPMPQGMTEDGEVRDTKNLAELLVQGLEAHAIKSKKIYFVAGSSRIASRRIQLPMVKKNQIQELIQTNSSEYFPVDISKYVLSYTILGEISEKADSSEETNPDRKNARNKGNKQYDLMVYAAPKSISAAYNELAENAGLTIQGIGYTGDSLYQAVQDIYAKGVHLLAKIEKKYTMISIIKDGDLALQRMVNYGVDMAIDTVMQETVFGEIENEWQALDALYTGKCLNAQLDAAPVEGMPELSAAKAEVTESFRYLIGNISRIMDYYISRNPGTVFDSVACCGLGAGIEGIAELFSHELAQQVQILQNFEGADRVRDGEQLYLYAAVAAPSVSGLNLMEKATKKKKREQETLSGALVIAAIGIGAGVLLSAVGIGSHVYQNLTKASLEKQIAAKQDIQDIYDAYSSAKSRTASYEGLYAYTDTPNEQLRDFLEEMEQKMPSDLTLDSFTSDGTGVSFDLYVSNKNEAAQVLIQMRTFESLASVTTNSLEEGENGEVTMTVTCTYAQPAAVDSNAQ